MSIDLPSFAFLMHLLAGTKFFQGLLDTLTGPLQLARIAKTIVGAHADFFPVFQHQGKCYAMAMRYMIVGDIVNGNDD